MADEALVPKDNGALVVPSRMGLLGGLEDFTPADLKLNSELRLTRDGKLKLNREELKELRVVFLRCTRFRKLNEGTDANMRTICASMNGLVPQEDVLAPKAKEAFDKALHALDQNKLDEAEKYLGEALRLAPGHPDVLFVQGVLFLGRRHWTDAQSVLEKATQLDGSNARAFAALGMALTNQSKYAEAVPMFEKSVQLEPPGSWETNWSLGKAYYYHQQYPEALKTAQQALTQSNGKAPQIQLLVAQSLTAVGRYDDAAQTLREFLQKNADRPEAATAKRWLDGLAKSGKIRQN